MMYFSPIIYSISLFLREAENCYLLFSFSNWIELIRMHQFNSEFALSSLSHTQAHTRIFPLVKVTVSVYEVFETDWNVGALVDSDWRAE